MLPVKRPNGACFLKPNRNCYSLKMQVLLFLRQYEQKFFELAVGWEKQTYNEQKERLLKLLNINSNKDGKDI